MKICKGSSRSGIDNFRESIKFMANKDIQNRLEVIICENKLVLNIDDIHRVFNADLNTPFKTVFKWEL